MQRIFYNEDFLAININKAENFYTKVIVHELLSKFYIDEKIPCAYDLEYEESQLQSKIFRENQSVLMNEDDDESFFDDIEMPSDIYNL